MKTERFDANRTREGDDSNLIPFRPALVPSAGRHQRRKGDRTRASSAWVISDETRMALEKCELLRDLDRHQLMAVAALVEEHTFMPSDVLIEEGRPAQYIYVVTEGHAVAQIQTEHGWFSLGPVGPGETAGWSSLVDAKIYPATVRALTEMRTARIDADGLKLLLSLEPEIGFLIHKRLSAIFCRQYETALRGLKTTG